MADLDVTTDPVFVSLSDSSDDCIKALDLEGRILACNPAGLALLEVERFDQIRGGVWADMWTGHRKAMVQAAVGKAAAGLISKFTADCRVPSGVTKHFDVTIAPVRGPDGEVASLLTTAREVTARVEAERRADAMAQQLERKMAARQNG